MGSFPEGLCVSAVYPADRAVIDQHPAASEHIGMCFS